MFKKSKVIVIEKRANDNGLLLNSIFKNDTRFFMGTKLIITTS